MLVLFDIGSTLLEGSARGPGSRLIEALGLDPAASGRLSELLFQGAYSSADDLAAQVAREFSLSLPSVLGVVRTLWDAQVAEAYPLPGAHQALDIASAAGHRVAFVSNIWPPFLEAFRRHFPAAYANCPGYYSFRMRLAKPDPCFFQVALDDLGADPRSAVVIGDTYTNDIRPAIDLGMRTIWVLHRPEKERANIVHVINGSAPRPSITVPDIAKVTVAHLSLLLD